MKDNHKGRPKPTLRTTTPQDRSKELDNQPLRPKSLKLTIKNRDRSQMKRQPSTATEATDADNQAVGPKPSSMTITNHDRRHSPQLTEAICLDNHE